MRHIRSTRKNPNGALKTSNSKSEIKGSNTQELGHIRFALLSDAHLLVNAHKI